MLIKTAGVTTKRISMEHTYTKEVAEKKEKENQIQKKAKEEKEESQIT